MRARLTEIANGLKNSPTNPGMNARGINTTTVVNVDEIIAALDLMVRREKVILDVARGSNFNVERLKDAWKQSSQISE